MSTTAVNGVSDDLIYTGFWTNWSHGAIKGATITFTNSNGALLIAFLALFVTTVGSSFWRLVCFVTHTNLSTRTDQDAIYHQRQAILRNADTSLVGVQHLLRLAWSWRRKSHSMWLRLGPLIGISILLTIGFYVASIFSSQISTVTANEVLLSSPKCGLYPLNTSILAEYNDLLPYASRLTTASASYAQQCYGGSNASQGCSMFVQKQIPRSILTNASCPFPGTDKICMRNSTNLRIDTGLIDSDEHFGMNARLEDRFKYREVIDCAPLRTKGYSSISRGVLGNGSVVEEMAYGRGFGEISNITFRWPAQQIKEVNDYFLGAATYLHDTPEASTFSPIPDLLRDDADITVVFLTANLVKFIQTVDDELFAAHRLWNNTVILGSAGESSSQQLYGFDGVIHALGCASQFQLCLSATDCTSLGPWESVKSIAVDKTVTARQKASILAFIHDNGQTGTELINVIGSLGAGALVARNSYGGSVQGSLKPNQWQVEVQHWQATLMARRQRVAVEHATGPSDTQVEKYLTRPQNGADKDVCENQKVRSTSHTSFSVLGLCITFIIGSIIMLLESIAQPLLKRFERRSSSRKYQRLEWNSNETLQLQRMAHEAVGAGSWTDAAETVPTTAEGELLATINTSDETHPRLLFKAPSRF